MLLSVHNANVKMVHSLFTVILGIRYYSKNSLHCFIERLTHNENLLIQQYRILATFCYGL